jgi:hypothetical protein
VYTRRDEIPVMSGLEATAAWLRQRPGAVVVSAAADVERLRAELAGLEIVLCRRFGDDSVCVAQSGRNASSGNAARVTTRLPQIR